MNESNRMITEILKNRGPIVIDLIPLMSESTLNIICETTMGISLKNYTAPKKYRDVVHQEAEVVVYRFLRFWLHKEWITSLLPIGKRQKQLIDTLRSFTENIIAERKDYYERTGRYLKNIENDTAAGVDDTEISGIKKRWLAMLDLLIAASQENKLTDSDIKEEVDTFVAAGHETTALAVCYTLMLAEHKDIQIFFDKRL